MTKKKQDYERKMIYVTDYDIDELIEIMAEGNIEASTWLKKLLSDMCMIKPTSKKEDAKLVDSVGMRGFYDFCEKLIDQNIRGFQLAKYSKVLKYYSENKYLAKSFGKNLEQQMINELNAKVYGLDLNKAVVSGASEMEEFPKFTRKDAIGYIKGKGGLFLKGKEPQENSYVGYTKKDAKLIYKRYGAQKEADKTRSK